MRTRPEGVTHSPRRSYAFAPNDLRIRPEGVTHSPRRCYAFAPKVLRIRLGEQNTTIRVTRDNTDIRAQHWAIVNDLKETKLRSLAWRVLHNIYPTNILLFKMKLVPSQNCPSCGEIDFVEHFFYSCVRIKPLWLEIERDINVTLGVVFRIKEVDVITGAHNYKEISSIILKKINLFIAIGRMVVSKFRYGKARNIFEIYETECHLRKLK